MLEASDAGVRLCYDKGIRTTLTLDDDVFSAARSLAAARGLSLGKAVSELARRGATSELSLRKKNGFFVFDVPLDAPRFGLTEVQAARGGGR